MFLAKKTKNCLTIDEYGIIQHYMTFNGFNHSKRLLDRSQFFKMIEGKKISAILPSSWKKLFSNGIVIPAKMRFCNECRKEKCCDSSNNQVYENKDVEANLNELKRQPPNEIVYMLS